MNVFVGIVKRAAERKLRVPMDYLGQMGDSSFGGFFKFLLFLPLSGHHKKADGQMMHAVRIVSTQHEDCGPCVQIAVNTALDEGIEPGVIQSILKRDFAKLSPDVVLAIQFAEGVLLRDGTDLAAREQIESQFGATVVTELSLSVATARVFPTVKRGMGFATACSLDGITGLTAKDQ